MEIFDFALFAKFDENLSVLSTSLTLWESWEYTDPAKEIREGNNSARFQFPILRNYLEYTYRKLRSEDKIVYTDDKQFCSFNTGLVTPHYEDIYAFFEENHSKSKKCPYFFKAFVRESDREFLSYFSDRTPQLANYFEQPELLIFNPKLNIVKDISHIIDEGRERFPEPIRRASDRELRNQLIGAIDEATKKARSNYKLGIPQWYNNKIQLLLPLYLTNSDEADLAIALEKINPTTYLAGVCLTTGMAYNNARLIVRPYSEWLKP